MYLTGLATALPPNRFTQAECWSALQSSPQFPQFNPRSRALLRKLLSGKNGIVSRYLALSDLTESFALTPDALHARFANHAPTLATQAAERAIADAHLTSAEIDAVVISTCTGYLCPGLTSYVSERLGLRTDVLGLDLVGQGCGAALPNFRTAEALVASERAEHVLTICVEVCSAAFYLDNDPGVLVSACLFGDGAGAAVWSAKPATHSRRVEWKTADTLLDSASRDLLRFEQSDGMLRNILDRRVPEIAATHAEKLLQKMLEKNSLTANDISAWILHAGGREVLRALQKHLNLTENDVRRSTEILSECGNLSSPFVFFVLEKALKESAPDGWWWLSSFGAGFSCHAALLQVGSSKSNV